MKKDLKAFSFYPSSFSIKEYAVEFPSGKKISITWNKPYVTHIPEELDFLSKQTALRASNVDYDSFRTYISDFVSDIDPDVSNKNLTENEARRMMWKDEDEDKVANILKEKGWIVYRKKHNK